MVSRNPRQKRRAGGRGRKRWRAVTSALTITTHWTRARMAMCRLSQTPAPSTATVRDREWSVVSLVMASLQVSASGLGAMLAATMGLSFRSTWGWSTCWMTRARPRPGSRCRSSPSWSSSFRRWELCYLTDFHPIPMMYYRH